MSSFASSPFVPPQVSTHGYSQNQILVWKYPSLVQVAKLTGHTFRVLYLVSQHYSVSSDVVCKIDLSDLKDSLKEMFSTC